MRRISYWAKQHPVKARFIIIAAHLLLVALAFFIGAGLYDLAIQLTYWWFLCFSALFMTMVFIYPYHRKPFLSGKQFYIRRKSCDAIVALCSFCLLCWVANTYRQQTTPATLLPVGSTEVIASSGKPSAAEILASLSHRDKKNLTRAEKRIIKKEFRRQLKIYVKAKITGDKKTADDAMLIILACIAAVGLLYLVAAAACSLSCNGSDAAAVIVGVLGTVAIIWLLVIVIRKISKGKKAPPPDK